MAEEAEARSSDTQSSIPSSSDDSLKQALVLSNPGCPAFPNYGFQMYQFMYPAFVPGLVPTQNQEQANHGAGIYAVPVHPFMGPMAGPPLDTLIPLNYTVPTSSPADGGGVTGDQGQEGRQQAQAQHRQVVVRSYQTGVLTPLIRWLSQGRHRAGAPLQPRPPMRAMNEGAPANAGAGAVAMPVQGGQGNEDENRPAENNADPQAIQNENPVEPGRRDGWLGIVREIQMIVIGFIQSLLPGYHHID